MSTIGRLQLESALAALGDLLQYRGLHYEVAVIGGGNLILRGLIERPTTKDVDLLGELAQDGIRKFRPMPEPLRQAVVDVALAYGLADNWFNTGPDSLLDFALPDGFTDRLERRAFAGLVLWLAGRFDMVCFKLYAAVDQGVKSRHFQDLRDLDPTSHELIDAAHWSITHDPSPGYRSVLVKVLAELGVEAADASLG